jgi:GntR family transcriptional regulator/MocR family aminotransferase
MELFLNYEFYVTVHRYKGAALFHALREAILQGNIKPHTMLPSTRELAKRYEVSRGTVNGVYDMLLSQGYIYTRAGSGTFVGDVQQQMLEEKQHLLEDTVELSHWGKRIQHLALPEQRTNPTNTASAPHTTKGNTIEFSLGKVALTHFPMKEWNRHLYEQAREQYEYELRDAFSSDGHYELKGAIARQVLKERGIIAEADDIMIVNGSQQAIALLAQLLLNEGDYVAMEDPHYIGARHALQSVGAIVHSFPVDAQGINFTPLQEQHFAYKLMLLTPSRQFPTGAVLSLERRMQLLQWAQQHNSYIIEDDYDSEFRHVGRAIEPMKSLDTAGRVIYIGTFSRTMLQDLRIGYAILPQSLKAAFRHAKMVYERHPSSIIQQRALAAFMNSGQYDRHLRRLKRLYRRRAELMQHMLHVHLSHVLVAESAQAGLHIYAVWQRNEWQFEAFLQACTVEGVYVVDARRYGINAVQPAVCLGYAHLSEDYIEEGMRRLLLAWESVK